GKTTRSPGSMDESTAILSIICCCRRRSSLQGIGRSGFLFPVLSRLTASPGRGCRWWRHANVERWNADTTSLTQNEMFVGTQCLPVYDGDCLHDHLERAANRVLADITADHVGIPCI